MDQDASFIISRVASEPDVIVLLLQSTFSNHQFQQHRIIVRLRRRRRQKRWKGQVLIIFLDVVLHVVHTQIYVRHERLTPTCCFLSPLHSSAFIFNYSKYSSSIHLFLCGCHKISFLPFLRVNRITYSPLRPSIQFRYSKFALNTE